MLLSLLATVAGSALFASAQNVRRDPGVFGPPLEIVHLFNDEWPTGIAVSSKGRKFANYPGGLDANDTNTGSNGKYTVAELFSNNTEKAYPSTAMNNPPGGAINRTTSPPTGAGYKDYLIGVQSVVIDSSDTLWILDTGRVIDPTSGMLLFASGNGPKLVAVDLTTNKVKRTITFSETVAYPDSYLNDVRFDLSRGYGYITDSSVEGRNGLITVDLKSGQSWRHLNNDPRVHPEEQFVSFVLGDPVYSVPGPGQPYTYLGFGADGIALSADGKDLYWSAVASRYLYSIPTARLQDHSMTSEVKAQAAVVNHGMAGVADGMETDSNGFIYRGNMEQEAIVQYNPQNSTVTTFIRDPRINWVDTMSVATDGYLYFTVNQLNYSPGIYPGYGPQGVDRRQRPFVLFRVKLPGNGTKINPC